MDEVSVSPAGKADHKEGQAVEDVGNDEAVLLDVRGDEEWSAGHAKGAIHWELARLEDGELPDIPKDARVYVLGAAGPAETAEEILLQNDYNEVMTVGGLEEWENAGGEVI